MLQLSLLAALCASVVKAADSDDVEFLTNLVNDYKSNTAEYASFLRTASSIPGALTSLALQVATYTDDSYTTLLEDDDIDVDSLEDFATELPWYSRIAHDDSDDSDDESSSSSGSSGSSSSSSSSGSSSAASSSATSTDGVNMLVAPAGAFLAAAAVALL